MENNQDMLNCPVCLDLSKEPHECLSCGNIFCHKCIASLSVCPMCRAKTTFSESKIAKKLINNLPIECPDCGFKTSRIEMKNHESKCEQKKFSCKFPQCSGFRTGKYDFLEHIIVYHPNELIEEFTQINRSSHNLSSNEDSNGLTWIDGSKIYKKSGKFKFAVSSNIVLKGTFTVKVRFLNSKNFGYNLIGFTSKQYNGQTGYIGGETGKGDWSIAGNGNIGEEGKWNVKDKIKYSDEILTLSYSDGNISVSVANRKSNYTYYLNSPNGVYLTAGLYFDGDEVEIVSFNS